MTTLVARPTSEVVDPPPSTDPPMWLGSSYGIDTVHGSNQQAGFEAWHNELRNVDGSKPGGTNNGLAVHRTYRSSNPPATFAQSEAGPDVALGIWSMWSCKPQATNVLNGSLDSLFTGFFNSIPAGHKCWLMMWHEPWDKLGNQFSSWSQFRAAQAHVWQLLQDSNANTADVKWGILGTGFDFTQGRAQTNYYPGYGDGAGDGLIGSCDFVGVDTYDFFRDSAASADSASPFTAPNDLRGRDDYRTPAEMFGAVFDFAEVAELPVIVGEFSFHPDEDHLDSTNGAGTKSRPQRIQELIDFFVSQVAPCHAACIFESHNGDSGPWWWAAVHRFVDHTNATTEAATEDNRFDRTTPDLPTITKTRDLLSVYGKAAA